MKIVPSDNFKKALVRVGRNDLCKGFVVSDEDYAFYLKEAVRLHKDYSEEDKHIWAAYTAVTKQRKPVAVVHKHKTSNAERWLWLWRLAVLAILIVIAARNGHSQFSQIENIQFQNAAGTLIKTYAAPFAIRCGTNTICTATGRVITFTLGGAVIINPMTQQGDMIYGGAAGAPTRLAIGSSTQVLHGGSVPTWLPVVEADLALTDITTANATTLLHGFLPRLSGSATQFLNGQGNYATISGSSVPSSYIAVSFSGQTSVNVVHNFGVYPLVQVLDGSHVELIPQNVTDNTVNDFTVTFSSSTTGTIIATVGSPQPQGVLVVSADYAILTSDRIIQCSAAGKTITFPAASGNTGREFIVDNSSNGDITLASAGGNIEGETAQTLPSQSAVVVYSDGTNWRVW